MPVTAFKCKALNAEIPCAACLKIFGCPGAIRCASRPYLAAAAASRVWAGVPSVTQLLQPTHAAMLKIIKEYTVDPLKSVWPYYGTATHNLLSKHTEDLDGKSEERITVWGISGAFDYADAEGLIDLKVTGQTKAKIIASKQAHEYIMQLNMYRLMLLKAKIFNSIPAIYIQNVIRDAYPPKNSAFIRQPIMPSRQVLRYFFTKRDRLIEAVATKKSIPCWEEKDWESFGGKRCSLYCDVNSVCEYFKAQKNTKGGEKW